MASPSHVLSRSPLTKPAAALPSSTVQPVPELCRSQQACRQSRRPICRRTGAQRQQQQQWRCAAAAEGATSAATPVGAKITSQAEATGPLVFPSSYLSKAPAADCWNLPTSLSATPLALFELTSCQNASMAKWHRFTMDKGHICPHQHLDVVRSSCSCTTSACNFSMGRHRLTAPERNGWPEYR